MSWYTSLHTDMPNVDIHLYAHLYKQVAHVPRLIQLEVGDESERKRTWRDVWKEVGRR